MRRHQTLECNTPQAQQSGGRSDNKLWTPVTRGVETVTTRWNQDHTSTFSCRRQVPQKGGGG